MGGKKIRQHNSLTQKLPPDVMRDVDRMLIEGSVTYDDIKAYLDNLGYDISRSAIGRHGKDFFDQYQRLKMIEDKSRVLVSEAGDGMVLEEALSKVFAQKILETQLDNSLDIKQLPRIISDFAKLQASSVMRERMKADFKTKFDKAADKVAKKKNVDPETLRMIREEVYGVI